MRNISVKQPYNAELIYTVYSLGSKSFRPVYSGDDKDYIYFSYPSSSVFCLFYEYKSRPRPLRRAYIVTGDVRPGQESKHLPGVDMPVKYIFVAKGHEVDNLKRCVKYLSQKSEKFFYLPPLFWYRLAGLIEYEGRTRRKATVRKSQVYELYKKYQQDLKERKRSYDSNKRDA